MRPARLRRRGRLVPALAVGLLLLLPLGWWWMEAEGAGMSPAQPATASGPVPLPATAVAAVVPGHSAAAAASAVFGMPLTAKERRERQALWQARLVAAREALDDYRLAARYPHDSRPASEHADQLRPFDPIVEDQPLKVPGGNPLQGVRLRTSQERVYLSGNEKSLVSLSLVDADGRTLALRVRRAVLREVPPPGATSRSADFAVNLNDAGQSGDSVASDGVYTAWVQPQAQGFAAVDGLLRLELDLDHGGQPGFLYFDFIYSPQTAARWIPGVREALEGGSLAFYLKAEILLPGRYVVSARVDDSNGRSFAWLQFNGELASGTQEIRLPLFGKLVLDEGAQFPVRLRDVEAFLLKPDTYPDRVMLPRLVGAVHVSKAYAASDFSAATWASDERDRYLAELSGDVERAEKELEKLGP